MLHLLFPRRGRRKLFPDRERRVRRLTFQALESREMMTGIPQLSSLPGAPHTIYLDFDGDYQSVWNRTDSNQTYTNVNVGEFNIDGAPGISAGEEAAIRKIWETAADDFAPFNVNVTTVEPPSLADTVTRYDAKVAGVNGAAAAPSAFTNGVGLRVVMAGASSAVLRTGAGTIFNLPTRDVFISDDEGNMVDTSGYAALDSYTNAEPNVVYVFAKYMSTWSNIDSENRYRDWRATIATTASHEAGHAFGLEHHGDYDVGTSIITPIMGSNTQGDRTVWSSYPVNGATVDSRAVLTNLLGARPDDHGADLKNATNILLSYSLLRGWSGSAQGVIGTTHDSDLFHFTTASTNTYQITVAPPQFGNLDAQLVLYKVRSDFGYRESLEQVAFSDPAIKGSPFTGLGASITIQLPAGKWAVAVRSHGNYGDIGGYGLTVSIPSSQIYYDFRSGGVYASTTTASPQLTTSKSTTTYAVTTTRLLSSGAGSGTLSPSSPAAKISAITGRQIRDELFREDGPGFWT